MMAVLIILLAVIAITIWYIIADEMRSIAAQKGHDSSKYFHYCFWLGIAGWAIVIALPDRGPQDKAEPQDADTKKAVKNKMDFDLDELPGL
jgi:hypothetical protein